MRDVAIVGAGMLRFGRYPEKGIKDLVREAVEAALQDAGIDKGMIEAAYVGSAVPGIMTGQEQIKAQVTLSAMGIESIPMYNIENACASSSSALNLAWTSVAAGLYDCALVVGFEKLYDKDKLKSFMALGTAVDIEMALKMLADFQKKQGEDEAILSADSGKSKSIFMDMYAYYTRKYMETYGLTQNHFARLCVKGHKNGSLNPHAMYQKEVTIEEVLQSGDVAFPLTRMMCSPVCDGSAAVVICSKSAAQNIKAKPVWIAASVVGSGRISDNIGDTLTRRLAPLAYEAAGIGPEAIDVVEVHDATTPSEIISLIELGLVPGEDAHRWIENGDLDISGRLASNPSGGLTSKGHPIGATGLAQIYEIVHQLRGTAGKRQTNNPSVGMTHNGGGILGVDAAAMALHILKR
ncbi:MAG: thiolase [Desulfobacterales bacterium CG23_combo_of_CG06-09_8_20_14_all_51_8]|nr:MAG: thiolase [Desulfobacterales bacterium CG23_combo_of_CG06-09_8_20_14_all_51_8]